MAPARFANPDFYFKKDMKVKRKLNIGSIVARSPYLNLKHVSPIHKIGDTC